MYEQLVIGGMFCAVGMAGLAVGIGAWLPKNKGLPDWLMAIGATLCWVCFLGTMAMLFLKLGGVFGRATETVGLTMIAGMGFGLVLFSMGYIMDRMRHRQVQTFEAQLQPPREGAQGQD